MLRKLTASQSLVRGRVLFQGLPGSRGAVDLGPRPQVSVWYQRCAYLLGQKPGAQVPGDDSEKLLLALAWLPGLWARWVLQVAPGIGAPCLFTL